MPNYKTDLVKTNEMAYFSVLHLMVFKYKLS